MKGSGKNVTVKIEGDLLVVNGIIIPYDQQVIRNKSTLFLTDIGIEVPIDKELRDFDEYYFHFLLKQQIVSELEASHISTSLQILHELPQLEPQHYAYLFRKLSINKVSRMMMEDSFYLFVWTKFETFKKNSTRQTEQMRAKLIDLNEPYKRLMHLLISLEQQAGQLKASLETTANELVFSKLNTLYFIQGLAYAQGPKQSGPTLNRSFLQELYNLTISLKYLLKIPQQAGQEVHLCKNSTVKSFLFNKECLTIIGRHFKQLYQRDYNNLVLVLSLTATQNPEELWKATICAPPEHCEQAWMGNNKSLLRQVTINNFFSNNSNWWSQSLHMLECLSRQNEAQEFLIDIYEDLIRFQLKIDAIDLITQFIKRHYPNKDKRVPQFKLFLQSFLYSIGGKINQEYLNYFQKLNKYRSKKLHLFLMKIPFFPHINSKMICAYMRVFVLIAELGLFEEMGSLHLEARVQELLALSRGRSGLLQGTRRILIRSIKVNLMNEEVRANSKKDVSANSRRQLLKKIINDCL